MRLSRWSTGAIYNCDFVSCKEKIPQERVVEDLRPSRWGWIISFKQPLDKSVDTLG